MRSPSRILLLVLALLVAASLAAPGLVSAHVRLPESPATPASSAATAVAADARPLGIVAAAPAPRPLWPLAAGVGLAALTLAVVAPRRTFGVALVVVLAVFAVETGVHSVHHMADQKAATQCVVSAASAHVQGASMEAPASAPWMPMPVGTVAVAAAVRPGSSPLRPDEGRAPPA
jgi:hypothetical protein